MPYGILGINARNQKYLKSSRRSRRILDSKLLTKKILSDAGICVLDTIAVIKTREELANFDWSILPNDFALKPNRGLGGEGIQVVFGRKKKSEDLIWVKGHGSYISKDEIETRISDILDGNFSLYSLPDVAFFEERVKSARELKPYSWKGVPDLRIIVFEGVPTMAMLRLPTEESSGKANLHQGAIGVGVDLATGITTSAIWHKKFIDYYPGTRYLLRGIKIPYFKKILSLAVSSFFSVNVKFLGVDITIDREKGPVILEMNARPGTIIQLANLAGLEERLNRIKGLKLKSQKRGVRLAQELFGEGESESEELFGKKVLGAIEEVEIFLPERKERIKGERKEKNKSFKILAKIDTGAWRTAISFKLAKRLGIEIDSKEDAFEEKTVKSAMGEETRKVIPFSFNLAGEKIETNAFLADRSNLAYDMIVGRRDLKDFIINPFKENKK